GTAIAVVSFAVGLPWGALGVAIAYTLVDLIVRAPLLIWWVGRSGPVGIKDLAACLVPAWTFAGCVAVAYVAIDHLLSRAAGGVRVAICAPASLAIGCVALALTPWGRAVFDDGVRMWRTLREAAPRSRA